MESKKRTYKKKDPKNSEIYSRCLLSRPVNLNILHVGKNLKSTIEKKLRAGLEGRCIVEGFVKSGSVKIISYTSGVVNGENVRFDVSLECEVCYPVEGMIITCIARNITKAGIRAETSDESPSPIVCFVSRDHHSNSSQFSAIEENQTFSCKVIGQRFELNDKYVSVLAELTIDKK